MLGHGPFSGAPGGGGGGGGGGVTGSSDSSLSISGADATINRATAGAWGAQHTFTASAVPVTTTVTDGGTTTQIEALRVAHMTSATAANGIGVYISLQDENASGNLAEAAQLRGILRGVTNGAENGVLAAYVANGGAQTLCGWATAGQWYAPTLALGSLDVAGATTQTFQVAINSTMVEYKSNAAANGGHHFVGTTNVSGARSFAVFTPSSNTGTTASTAVPGFDWQTYTRTWATGAGPAEQVEFKVGAPTYAAAAASTFPIASTLAITGAPIPGTNMTITKPLAFHVQAGGSQFDGNIGMYGVAPAAQGVSGYAATNNVTVGGTDGTIADFAASSYATDAATIRNDIYQLAKMVKQHHDWLRAAGPLT